jgi:hypothetical protein
LLDPTQLLNLCFFFECPISHQKYTEANTNDSLDLLGPFSRSRWKYMTEIHVLFPSDVGHMYIVERGDLPHYQEVFSKFVLALERYDNQMPVYLYMRGEDYSNHFMLVRNLAKTVQPFMDWMDIHRSLFCPKKKAEKPTGIGKRRQDNFQDSGFCCGVSLTWDGTSGVAGPRMKPGTMQNASMLNGYAVLTDFIVSTPIKWTEGKDRLFHNADNPKRQERFATLVNKKKRVIEYKKLRQHFCSTTKNCNLLVTNHILGICSCLGLLPSWVRGEIEVSPSSRYMQWFSSRFNLPTSRDSMEQLAETVRHALTKRYQTPFSRRKVENVLCKVYRSRTGSLSDKKFCDLVFPGQMIFT